MKQLIYQIFIIVTLSSIATAQTNTVQGKMTRPVQPGWYNLDVSGNRLHAIPAGTGVVRSIDLTLDVDKPVSKAQQLALNKKVEVATVSELRSRKMTTGAIALSDRPGVYLLDDTDRSSPDNGGTVLVSADGKRYKSNQKVITPALFGAIANGVNDDYKSLMAALQYAAKNSIPLEWEPGIYNVSGSLAINLSGSSGAMNKGGKRLSIHGAGIANTVIRYTGKAAVSVFDITGTTDDYLSIDGIRIITASSDRIPNSTGLKVARLANFHIANVAISFFDLGVNLVNAGEGLITNLTTEWNKRGLDATQSGTASKAVAPNVIHFNSCAFNSNTDYGIFIENGCNNTFTACRFLGNGSDDNGRAIKLIYTGQNGGVSASIIGGYFEGTRGTDIEIVSAAGGAHYLAGNTFNKFDNSRFANTHILFTPLNLVANDGKVNIISMVANAMWATPRYTPKSSRQTVVCSSGLNGYNGWVLDDNNYYQNSIEAPVYTASSRSKHEFYEPANYRVSNANAVGGVLDLTKKKEPYIYLSNISGTVIGKLLGGTVGKQVILQADNAITLKHTSNLMLKSHSDFTFSPGQTITLFCQAPNVFREVGRQ